MPYNGAGVFNTYTPGSPVAPATTISTTFENAKNADVATGLSNCITRDGQSPALADLPMGGKKHTGAAAGSARTDYGQLGQVQDAAFTYAVAGGTANALTLALSPVITAYVAGQEFRAVVAATNTAAATLAVDGLSAIAILDENGVALEGGEIAVGQNRFLYNGTNFILAKSSRRRGGNLDSNVGYGPSVMTVTNNGSNSGFGRRVLRVTTGTGNSGFGDNVLNVQTSGGSNSGFGASALSVLTTGSNCLGLGAGAGTDAVRTITTASNEIAIGNNSITGIFQKVAATVTSDARDKTEFAIVPHGLNFVNALLPVEYKFKDRETGAIQTGARYGFKAQDVLALEGNSPVVILNDDPENLKMRETMLIPILVKAIQELTARVAALEN